MNFKKTALYLRDLPILGILIKPLNSMWRIWFEHQVEKHPYRRFNHNHKMFYGVPANLEHPKTLHEKIYWMMYCTDITKWSELTDKVKVREWIKQKGLSTYLNQIYYIWDESLSYNDFAELLPTKCVVKTNNAGGGKGVYIIKDKTIENLKKIYNSLLSDLKTNYGVKTGQPHYCIIKPQIIVEKFLENTGDNIHSLPDYKILCFNGKAKYVNLVFNRSYADRKYIRQIFDKDWKRIRINKRDNTEDYPKPACFEDMLKLAEELSSGFPFVRVDLYEVAGHPVFGEMTFTPGFNEFYGEYGNKVLHLGEDCDISEQKQIRQIDQNLY